MDGNTDTTLKPCPFCGSEPIMRRGGRYGFWALCQHCGAALRMSDTEEDAANAWNRRAAKREDGNAAAMREAPVAVKEGVYTSDYGNRFAVVNVNLGGYRFVIHAGHTGFYPHIKVKDQKEVLNRVMGELVDCINKGAAVLAKPPRNCDRTKGEAEELFKERFGRPWTQAEDELAAWLFAPAEGGAP